MNSQERIGATLAGERTDRRAVAPVLGLYGARLSGCCLDEYYTNPKAYARGQAAVREMFQPDLLFGPFALATIGAAFGGKLHSFAKQAPNIEAPAIHEANEWETLEVPDADRQADLVFLQEAIRLLAAEHRGQVPIVGVLPSPIDLPPLVMGMDGWMETILFDQEGTQRVLEKVIPFCVNLANRMLANGAALVAFTCAYASSVIVTRDLAAGFARPAMARTLAELRGPAFLHHGGSPMLAHLDLLRALPSVVSYAVDERDNLDRARQVVGPEAVLLSGPMAPRLPQMAPAEVESCCRAMLENRREDPRFALCTCGPDVPWDTPPETVLAMRKAAEEFAS